MIRTAIAMAVAMLVVVAAAHGEEGPTREEYVAQVEPICQRNTVANERILKGAKDRIKQDELNAAGGQFIRASEAFGKTVRQLVAVPRPPADDARLMKWFHFLGIVKTNLRNVGKSLREGNKIKATHDSIRAERSGNAANNVSIVYGFHYCRLSASRFR
ncbi:MAG TPA: hypothetical protein VFL89_04415 [Solirubrobacterales bacterium]|nr:hypothetical protein [Solirubrobacterales bacterium]